MDTPQIALDVSPTFTSTDLLAPSCKPRGTLPTIAKFYRPLLTNESICWGKVTVRSIAANKRDVTHRRFGTGCFNYLAPYQPYRITSLMLSHCRKNDQRSCPPEKRLINHNQDLLFQCPKENAYFSHTSKLSLFPQPFNTRSSWHCLTERTKALESLQQSLYTTCYQETYRQHHSDTSDSSVAMENSCEEENVKCSPTKATSTEAINIDKKSYTTLIGESDTSSNSNDNEEFKSDTSLLSSKETQTDCIQLTIDREPIFQKRDCRYNRILITVMNQEHYRAPVYNNEESKKDASTQTMIAVSLMQEIQSPPTPSFCRPYPSVPSMLRVEETTNKATTVMPKIRLKHRQPQYNQLSTKFRAHLRYNERYDTNDDRDHLKHGQWKSGKKMYFYGEHTSIFR